ncbi:MAG: Stp1/IreP family PP2C-type Ser/Thr phosphatase [Pseudomonadota bacterium]
MRVRFSGETNVGMKRAHNEDSLYLPIDERLTIVADGMGGHASGEVASKMAVDNIVEHFKATADEQTLTWPFKVDRGIRADLNRLVTAVKQANLQIHVSAQREAQCKGMGTTVVSGLFLDDKVIVAHVGDSRAYRIRNREIEQLTEDHSLINDYIRMKRMTAEEAAAWPHRNVIVRALGMKENVKVDIYTETLRIGDCYLFCSDGLSGMISDEHAMKVVGENADLDHAVEKLILAANEAGGADNITAVLARIEPA